MRERQLIDAIHRRLPKALHKQSMTSASLTYNGTPDCYYDGPKSDLWVEYKRVDHLPRDGILIPECTDLQKRWLARRWQNGKNAKVIVGLPTRHALKFEYPAQWEAGMRLVDARNLSYDEIAKWICDFCGCSFDRAVR